MKLSKSMARVLATLRNGGCGHNQWSLEANPVTLKALRARQLVDVRRRRGWINFPADYVTYRITDAGRAALAEHEEKKL